VCLQCIVVVPAQQRLLLNTSLEAAAGRSCIAEEEGMSD
jgi:hypothetical protein